MSHKLKFSTLMNVPGEGCAEKMDILTHEAGLTLWLAGPTRPQGKELMAAVLMPLSPCCNNLIQKKQNSTHFCRNCSSLLTFNGPTLVHSGEQLFRAAQLWFDNLGLNPFDAVMEASKLEATAEEYYKEKFSKSC